MLALFGACSRDKVAGEDRKVKDRGEGGEGSRVFEGKGLVAVGNEERGV